MSKRISPIWFLKEPIDQEHKEYILLDYLKEISKELNKENCYSIMKEISKIVKILNDFRRGKALSEYALKSLKKEDKAYANSFSIEELDQDQQETLMLIVEESLQTLYGYSEVCLDILKKNKKKNQK